MKNTVRIIAALLAGIMLLSAMACDSGDDSAEKSAPSDSGIESTAENTEPEVTEPEVTEPPYISAESIDIAFDGEGDPTEGDTGKLTVTVSPDDASVKDFSVAFSEDGIIELDSDGSIRFLAPGKVTLTVTHTDGVEASVDFNVLPAVVEADSVSLDRTSIELEVSKSEKLTAAVSPDDTTDRTVTWTSSDSTVASVSDDGTVKAVKEGSANITASTVNGKTAVCAVTVKSPEIPVTDIQLECLALNMTVGTSHNFTVSLIPANTTMNTVTVTSSDTSVISVSGLTFTANKAGSAVITITSKNGISKQVSVTAAEKPAVQETPASQTGTQTGSQTGAQTPQTPAQRPVIEEDMSLPQCDFPRVNGRVVCGNNRYFCISGTTVENSTVHAYITITASDGSKSVQEMDVTPQGTRYFLMFRINRGQSATIDLTAKTPGTRTSKACTTSCKYEKASGSSSNVFIGENSWLHFYATEDDFKGTNLFNSGDLASMEKNIFKTLENLRKRSGRDDIKSIYLIAPNNATIYPENAPTEWKEKKKSDNSRMKQIIELSKTWTEKDIIFIDLYDYLISQKNIGHLYYQTDTHWNKVGAFFGYYKLMNAIAVDFPEAKPHELSEFTMSEITYTGDMASYLGFNASAGSEKTLNLTPNFPTAVVSREGGEYGTNGIITTKVANDKLPTAVVQRDSFGTALHSLIAEHFSTLVYTSFGADRSEAYKVCDELAPDYFIRVMVERDLYGKILN